MNSSWLPSTPGRNYQLFRYKEVSKPSPECYTQYDGEVYGLPDIKPGPVVPYLGPVVYYWPGTRMVQSKLTRRVLKLLHWLDRRRYKKNQKASKRFAERLAANYAKKSS